MKVIAFLLLYPLLLLFLAVVALSALLSTPVLAAVLWAALLFGGYKLALRVSHHV